MSFLSMHSLSGHTSHLIFEIAAYFVAARVYRFYARAETLKPSTVDRFCMLAGAIFGAALGSKTLHILEQLPALMLQTNLNLWLGGKSVLGGFIGGTIGVEITKKLLAWKPSTGDAWVPALAVGLIIGRMGCQLSGTWDLTYGVPTNLPWAWDYGDHIGRHPTALYEILLVAILGLAVWRNADLKKASGARFAAFLLGYCAIRFALEFLKPPYGAAAFDALPVASYAGITAIQWAAALGAITYLWLMRFRLSQA
jgi:phosphatidylglycerol---prolipoprotein diacylglyceryl transferase